jgi:hypothetical protein
VFLFTYSKLKRNDQEFSHCKRQKIRTRMTAKYQPDAFGNAAHIAKGVAGPQATRAMAWGVEIILAHV